MSYMSLADIYKNLSPHGAASVQSKNAVLPRSLNEIFMDMFLDPRGRFYTFDAMKSKVDDYYTKISQEERDVAKISHHMLGKSIVNLGDQTYWKDVTSIADIVPSLSRKTNSPLKASVFVTRSPYVNPSSAGTSSSMSIDNSLDFIINYVPPMIAAQMVPYLQVEFHLAKPVQDLGGLTTLSTMSMMRFLLGSVDVTKQAPADKILSMEIFNAEANGTTFKPSVMAKSGMEMFLSPQTLTNMDSLGTTAGARLQKVKPFVPFASIEDFTVNIQNAGAGKFGSQKATLKLKIHDKARISELSEFLRSSGYNQSVVWTEYGWRVPARSKIDEDEYCNLINDKMKTKMCWKVANPQFSFDGSGQVTLSLELFSAASSILKNLYVSSGDSYQASVANLNRITEEITEFMNKYSAGKRFAVSVMGSQLLNAASTAGSFVDFTGNVPETIQSVCNSLKKSGIPQEELANLKANLEKLVTDKTKSGTSYDLLSLSAASAAKAKFDSLSSGVDPFLPTKDKSDYFNGELTNLVDSYRKSSEARNSAIKNTQKTAKVSIDPKADVVSFGKLFLELVLPSLSASEECEEVQVFFYNLNDECGPLSGYSIAEFPIDVTSLAYAYAESLKNAAGDQLTIEAFLGIVSETQFSDVRAIGYGQQAAYMPYNPDKPRDAEQKSDKGASEKSLSAWLEKYGALRTPCIEMKVEFGEPGKPYTLATNTETLSNRIVRIHVYDKNSNPYPVLQQIIDSGDGKNVGYLSSKIVRDRIEKFTNGKSKEQLEKLKKSLDEGAAFETLDGVKNQGLNGFALDEFEVTIPRNREAFKSQLMKGVPCIVIGTNGSLVQNVNVASKTDGTMGAINISNSMKGTAGKKPTMTDNGLAEINGLPLRVLPVQVTLSTIGLPQAQLYQTFFIDFRTGTSLDNLYTCTGIQHTMTQGKFVTALTYMYTNGYGKFTAPQSVSALLSGELAAKIDSMLEIAKKSDKNKGKK